MPRVKKTNKHFYVVCDDYTYGPTTEDHAIRVKERIEDGGHCTLVHRIEDRSTDEA